MKIPFYLLGLLLRYGPQHGYRLKQIIEERISDFAKIKLPTIYYHLDKLKEKGYVVEFQDREGNRPEKMVYSITEAGEKYFRELFDSLLEQAFESEFALDGVLYFRDKISNEELVNVLKSKRQQLAKKLEATEKNKTNTLNNINELGRLSATLIFDHHLLHLEAELEWLARTIEGLSE